MLDSVSIVLASYTTNVVFAFIVLGLFIVVALVGLIFFLLGMRETKTYMDMSLPTAEVYENMDRIERMNDNSFANISKKDLDRIAHKKRVNEMSETERTRYEAKKHQKEEEQNIMLPMPVYDDSSDGLDEVDTPLPSVESGTAGDDYVDANDDIQQSFSPAMPDEDGIIVNDDEDDESMIVIDDEPAEPSRASHARHGRHSRTVDSNPFA